MGNEDDEEQLVCKNCGAQFDDEEEKEQHTCSA